MIDDEAPSVSEIADVNQPPPFDHDAFDKALKAGMSMNDIMLQNRERYASLSQHSKRTPRMPAQINVAVAVAGNAFGAEEYSEIKEVFVDSRIKTLKFWEDERPAYVGTYSKKSRIVNGRNPFGRDDELLNYDVDSEEEWDPDEADGEDIGNSDDDHDEDEEGNELMYDDFFRRDNDFGSDADSDGELISGNITNRKFEEEVLGPTFVRISASQPQQINAVRHGMQGVVVVMNAAREEDVKRLREYTAVIYDSKLPVLGASICDDNTETVKKTKKVKISDANKEGSASSEGNDSTADTKSKKKKTAPSSSEASSSNESDPNTASAGEGDKENDKKKKSAAKLKEGFDKDSLSSLVKHIHGKKDGIDKLVNSFHETYSNIPKAQIAKRMKEISDKQKHKDGYGTARWIVKQEFSEGVDGLENVEYTPVKAKSKGTKRPSSSAATSSTKSTANKDTTNSAVVPIDLSMDEGGEEDNAKLNKNSDSTIKSPSTKPVEKVVKSKSQRTLCFSSTSRHDNNDQGSAKKRRMDDANSSSPASCEASASSSMEAEVDNIDETVRRITESSSSSVSDDERDSVDDANEAASDKNAVEGEHNDDR